MKKQIRCRKDLGGCGILFSYEFKDGSGKGKRFCSECIIKRKREYGIRHYMKSIKKEVKSKQKRRSCIGVLCRGKVEFKPKSRYNRICGRCSIIIQGISDCEGITPNTRKR